MSARARSRTGLPGTHGRCPNLDSKRRCFAKWRQPYRENGCGRRARCISWHEGFGAAVFPRTSRRRAWREVRPSTMIPGNRITRRRNRNPSMTQPMAKRFPTPSIDQLPDDIRTRLLAVQEKSGFVPNVFLTLAYRPDEFRAFFAYHDALMEKDGGLTKAEREMIVVATSSANQCHYCVIAHGAILRIRAKSPQIADQIAVNYRKADITPRQRAMLDFAMKVSAEAHRISEADFIQIA